jgi:hypothetical protein
VVVDDRKHGLEDARLMLEVRLARRFAVEEPPAAEERDCSYHGERGETLLHVSALAPADRLPRNAKTGAGCIVEPSSQLRGRQRVDWGWPVLRQFRGRLSPGRDSIQGGDSGGGTHPHQFRCEEWAAGSRRGRRRDRVRVRGSRDSGWRDQHLVLQWVTARCLASIERLCDVRHRPSDFRSPT